MKIKVYMGDWFLNMGIVGFIRILKESNVFEGNVVMTDNYIEFESRFLESFSDYYFDYFIKEYQVSDKLEKKLEMYKNLIKSKPEKAKDYYKYAKDSIKYEADKVKKFDADNYKKLKENIDLLTKIKTYEQFEEAEKYMDDCLEIFKLKHIDEKLTLNLYKYVVGDNYFGQVSFFNVAKAKLDLEGLKKVMHNDYLLSIICFGELVDYIEIGDLEKLNNMIIERLEYFKEQVAAKNISGASIKTIEKIYKEIAKKYIKKKKSIEEIKEYMDNLSSCNMCGNYSGIVSNYTESNFAPLAVSADNSRNLYWNMEMNFELCDICKLMLFCTPAGTVLTEKKYLTGEDNEFYSYVNIESSIDDLYRKNENLKSSKDKEAPIKELILDIAEQEEKKCKWQLANILFVEFKGSVDAKKSKLNYFNMPMYLVQFFTKEVKSIEYINSIDLKNNVMDYILKEKDLKILIFTKLKEIISQDESKSYVYKINSNDIFKIVDIRAKLQYYKKGGEKSYMNNQNLHKSLEEIQKCGKEVRKYYKENIADKNAANKKIISNGYKLLNLIKAGNKDDFMNAFLKIVMGCEQIVPTGFINVMSEKYFDFESFGYAFVSGLLSEGKVNDENKKEENK